MDRTAQGRVALLVATQSLLTLVLLTGAVSQQRAASTSFDVPLLVWVAMFLVAERASSEISVRDQSVPVNIIEIASASALLFASPPVFVLARMLGPGAVAIARSRDPLRVSFNLSLFALDGAMTVWVFGLLTRGADLTSPRAWVASGAAIMAGSVVVFVCLAVVSSVTSGRRSSGGVARTMAAMAPFTLAMTGVGVLTAQLALRDPRGLYLGVAVAGAMYGLLQTFGLLVRRFHTLTDFHGHTAALQQVTDPQVAVELATTAVHELTGGVWAEVRVPGSARAHITVRSRLAGFDVHDHDVPPLSGADPARSLTIAELRARSPELRHGIVVGLRGDDGGPAGWLVVAHPRRFRDHRAVVQVLTTIARQTETVLQRSRLITDLRHELDDKAHRALHDDLTDLPNRAAMVTDITAAIEGSRHVDGGFAVIVLDLERFRTFNETLGHHAGDLVLNEVASRLRRSIRQGDSAARIGNHAFCVLARAVHSDAEAHAVAMRLLGDVAGVADVEGVRLDLSFTLGVAVAPDHGRDAQLLLRRADTALRAGRSEGLLVRLHGGDEGDARRRLAIAAELRAAIPAGAVVAHYQPQIELTTGRIVGVEALARWTDPELGFVSPGEFVPIAEQTGAVVPLTTSMLAQAVAQLRIWADLGIDLQMSVNISPRVLAVEGFADDVTALLAAHGVPADRLVLEITESLFVGGSRASEGLDALHRIGALLSIDDYGTGYSSLNYLHRLHAHELKIDRSFLLSLETEPARHVIVASTIDLAHSLGMTVVAEGVEDVPTMQVLRDLGCDVMQGYLSARPMPPDVCTTWMQALPDGRWQAEEPSTQAA